MVTIKTLYLFFILAGITIILTLIYLRYLTSKSLKAFAAFFDMNEKAGYDLHAFVPSILPILKKSGVEDVFYKIRYLDTVLEKTKEVDKEDLRKSFERVDYRIDLGIVPRSCKGERKYIYLMTLEILFLLVEMDVLVRIKAVNEAFSNFSRLQTFMMHDVKNLTQFIQALSYNLEHMEGNEREERFIEYLRQSAPGLSVRANRILTTIEMGSKELEEVGTPSHIDLCAMLAGLAATYPLKVEVEGAGSAALEEHRIASVFDNVLKNIYEKSLQEPEVQCLISVREEKAKVRITISDTGSPVRDIERIFEPFYTTKKAGLGIGLFQARNLVESMGGEMKATNLHAKVEFEIVLPRGQT